MIQDLEFYFNMFNALICTGNAVHVLSCFVASYYVTLNRPDIPLVLRDSNLINLFNLIFYRNHYMKPFLNAYMIL